MFKVWGDRESRRIGEKIARQGIKFLLGGCIYLAISLSRGSHKLKKNKASMVSKLVNVNIEKENRTEKLMDKYETYENHANPHITVHVSGCSQLRKHGGKHKYNNGKYSSFQNIEEATAYADTTGLPVKQCKFCIK